METRVQKYKVYRASLIKENTNVYRSDKRQFTTNTLPLDEVMSTANQKSDDELIRAKKKELILKYSILISIIVLLIVGVVLLGIFAFK